MSIEQNKTTIRRIVDEVFNQNKLTKIDELITPDWQYHGVMGTEFRGIEGFKKLLNEMHKAIPDLHVGLLDMVAEGDKVFHRWSFEGTISGNYQGMTFQPTRLSLDIFNLSVFSNGRETVVWEVYDSAANMQKMGLMPKMAAAAG
jgi:predicted ester cyclase